MSIEYVVARTLQVSLCNVIFNIIEMFQSHQFNIFIRLTNSSSIPQLDISSNGILVAGVKHVL